VADDEAKRPIRISRQESYLSVKLTPLRVDDATGEETAAASATGFLWAEDDKWYLITNHHVVTGWHPETGRAISPTAFSPTHLAFQIYLEMNSGPHGSRLQTSKAFRLELAKDGEPVWFQHPILGDKVDVVAIPLFDPPNEEELEKLGAIAVLSVPVNRHPGWVTFKPAVADDAYVLGFPKGMSGGPFAIWKRASIASEPDIDLDGLPKLLIDTATRSGMSGAPVVAFRRGFTSPTGKIEDALLGDCLAFLGVYSGRIGDDTLGLQLGIVWKASTVEEIVVGQAIGRWPWDL